MNESWLSPTQTHCGGSRMHPLGYARAPPPMRRPSSRSNLTSSAPANPSTNSQSLQKKLSSNSLSMSLPPDSPPVTEFDEINYEPSNFGTPDSPTRSKTTGDQFNSLTADFENTPSHQASNNRIPFPQSSSTTGLRQHARTLSLRSARKAVIEHTGSPTAKGIDVPLSQEWLLSQTRTDLEALLAEADKAIRERQRDLELAAAVGKSLLEENIALRSRQESLLSSVPPSLRPSASFTRTQSEVHDRSSPSPRNWRVSLGFPPPSFISPSRSRQSIDSAQSWDEDNKFTSNRTRTTSSASTKSLFATDTNARRVVSPGPQQTEVQSLNHDNYYLTLQLSELQADAEKAEREGMKKLRKVEKEMAALRGELERVEQRNDALEGELFLEQEREANCRAMTDGSEDGSISDDLGSVDADNGTPKMRNLPTLLVETPKSSSSSTLLHKMASSVSPDTPTQFFTPRTPGVGYRLSDALRTSPPPSPLLAISSAAEKVSEAKVESLLASLMETIEELEETNEAVSEERREIGKRLDQAQIDLDDFRRRCEDMEDQLLSNGLEWDAGKGTIEWLPGEKDRPKGNRRMIEHLQRRRSQNDNQNLEHTPLSISDSNTSLSSVASDARSWNQNDSPISLRKPKGSRMLGSEMGSPWEGGEDSEGEDGEDEQSSASTSIPYRQQPQHRRIAPSFRNLDHLDTSYDLVPAGSLRHGEASEAEYAALQAASAELPVAWEDEMEDRLTGRKRIKARGKGSRRPDRTVLSAIAYREEEEDNEEFWKEKHKGGRSFNEIRGTIEYGEKKSRKQRRQKPVQDTDESFDLPASQSSLTRRSLALRRLGLPHDEGSSTLVSDYSDDESDYAGSVYSSFDYLRSGEYAGREGTDYYPTGLARYHPKMVAVRLQSAATQQAMLLLTYIRFFVVLGLAICWALWQGPKKTLALIDNRNNNHRRRT